MRPDALPDLPCDAEGPVFGAPWQARAFALTVALVERGVFGWQEWAETLGASIRKAQGAGDPDLGDTYYRHWLAALERLLVEKGLTGHGMLEIVRAAWDDRARATPHGQPIELPFAAIGDVAGQHGQPEQEHGHRR